MKILYGLCSWGLGHATRSLPVLRRLVAEGHELVIYTTGRALALLERELGQRCKMINGIGYPVPYVSGERGLWVKFALYLPAMLRAVQHEHKQISRIVDEEGVDLLIADQKYGAFHPNRPSFFIGHQLRFLVPYRLAPFELMTEYFQYVFRKKFKKFIVPDYAENDLSGDLSHNLRLFDTDKIAYVGILSDFVPQDVEQDIDYFISISGPEPSRTTFERKVLAQARHLPGRVVAVLGSPERVEKVDHDGIEVYGYAPPPERDILMSRAKMVICRSGYSTLMDLTELGKQALFVPTPGQTEQEYLARYLLGKKNFFYVRQRNMDLVNDVRVAESYPGLRPSTRTAESVETIMKIVFG
jgi:uncharacterized protein (TIGR00661 family)